MFIVMSFPDFASLYDGKNSGGHFKKNQSESVENPLDRFRPSNLYEETPLDILLRPGSAKEFMEVCCALIEGEKQFWQEQQQLMLQESEQLAIILKIMEKKENKLNFYLFAQIFHNQEYHNSYNLYRSLSTIIQNLDFLYKNLSVVSKLKTFDSLEDEKKFIENTLSILYAQSKANTNKTLKLRGLVSAPISKSKPYEIQEAQKGKFSSKLEENSPAKYALCDADYVHVIFFKYLRKIAEITSTVISDKLILLQQEQKEQKSKNLNIHNQLSKKQAYNKASKKARRKNKAKNLQTQETILSSESEKVLENSLIESFQNMEISPAVESSLVTNVQGTYQKEIRELENASELNRFGTDLTNNPIAQNSGEEPEKIDLMPWEQYKDKKKQLASVPFSDNKENQSNPLLDKLSVENLITAKTLLGLGKDYALESVLITDYANLVYKLGGYVIGAKKCVH